MASGRASGRAGGEGGVLEAPLLPSQPKSKVHVVVEAGQSEAGRQGLLQRIAAWPGPDPTTSLAALFVLAGLAWCMDVRARSLEASRRGVASQITQIDADGSLHFVEPGFFSVNGLPALPLPVLALLVLASLAVLQHFGDGFLRAMLAEAVGRPDLERLGAALAPGSFRISLLQGRLLFKNLELRSLEGSFQCDRVLTVRSLSLDVGVFGLLRVWLGGTVGIKELRIDGVDIVVEYEGDLASRTNLQAVLDHASASAPAAAVAEAFLGRPVLQVAVGKAVVVGATVRRLRCSAEPEAHGANAVPSASIPDLLFEDFSADQGLPWHAGAGEVLAALMGVVGDGAVAALQLATQR